MEATSTGSSIPLDQRILASMTLYEPYSAGDLANELGEQRRTVYNHLKNLAEEDQVRTKKHSTKKRTFWRVE